MNIMLVGAVKKIEIEILECLPPHTSLFIQVTDVPYTWHATGASLCYKQTAFRQGKSFLQQLTTKLIQLRSMNPSGNRLAGRY